AAPSCPHPVAAPAGAPGLRDSIRSSPLCGSRAPVAIEPVLTPPVEVPGGDLSACPLREADQETQVVQRQQPHPEHLAGHHEVAEVGARVVAAGITVTFRVEWTRVEPVAAGLQIDLALGGDPGGAVA